MEQWSPNRLERIDNVKAIAFARKQIMENDELAELESGIVTVTYSRWPPLGGTYIRSRERRKPEGLERRLAMECQ